SICAEGEKIDLRDSETGTNLRIGFSHQTRTYRLNRGPRTQDDPTGRGFEVVRGNWRLGRFTQLQGQYIALDQDGTLLATNGFDPEPATGASPRFWLAAPKTTDALYLCPQAVLPGLRLHKVGGPDPARTRPPRAGAPEPKGVTSVRAAALSATYLL